MLIFSQEAFDSNKDIDQLRLSLSTLPTALNPTEIPAVYGKDQDVTAANNLGAGGSGGGISLGSEVNYNLITTDGLFVFQFPARSATLSDGAIVYIPSLPAP